MDATQFATFMKTFQETLKHLATEKAKSTPTSSTVASDSGTSSPPESSPKITLRIPTFRGEPGENVEVWLRQTKNVLRAQGITNEGKMIHYAATGFEDAALHWFVNKVKDSTTSAFTTWTQFVKELKDSFQPPHYQQYLRTQLRALRQEGTVQEYSSQFRNLVLQIDNMGPLDQVAYYVDGLKPATRMEVSYQAPESLDEAVKMAVRYDTAMFGLGRPVLLGRQGGPSKKGSYPQRRTYGPAPMDLDRVET